MQFHDISVQELKNFLDKVQEEKEVQFSITKVRALDPNKIAMVSKGDTFRGYANVYENPYGWHISVGRGLSDRLQTTAIKGVKRQSADYVWFIKTENSVYKLEMYDEA